MEPLAKVVAKREQLLAMKRALAPFKPSSGRLGVEGLGLRV